jgi:hypothetical protein
MIWIKNPVSFTPPAWLATQTSVPLAAMSAGLSNSTLFSAVVAAVVFDSAFSKVITFEDAEAWLRVLTLASSTLAHVAGVFTEKDSHTLDPPTKAVFFVLSCLQCMVMFALDPDIEAASQEVYELEQHFSL